MTKEDYEHWRAEIDLCTNVVVIEEIRALLHQRQDPHDLEDWWGSGCRFLALMKYAGERSDILWKGKR